MELSQSNSLAARLQPETDQLQAGLKKLPFFTTFSNGTLPLVSYVNQLRTYASLFNTLERLADYLVTVESSDNKSSLSAVLESVLRTGPGAEKNHFMLILNDLDYFNASTLPEINDVRRRVDTLIARMRFLANEDPLCLIGYLIALQSILEVNRAHMSDVQRAFNAEQANGTSFYAGHADRSNIYLANVSIDLEERSVDRVMLAVHECFAAMSEIHTYLYPLPTAECLKYSASSINPEASNHEVPADEREVAAAISAGRLCLEEFAYFIARYGERGRRFASGDSAWLVTLARLDYLELIRKVKWFGNFLAVQGMPRLTLERQLYYLHQELVKALPEKHEEYSMLLQAVEWLQRERFIHISAEDFASLSEAFTVMTDNELGGKMKGTGALIVSAVCDERSAVKVEKARCIETWLTNADNFSAEWISAVQEIFIQARAVAVCFP